MTEQQEDSAPSALDAQVEAILAEVEGGIEPAPIGPSRTLLDDEERLIKDAILRMGSLVEVAIRRAAQAMVGHDVDLARRVVESDPIINELQRGVTRLIVVTIATQQPVARDLRYLLTLDHVGYELERMGDHASSVAKQVLKLAQEPPLEGWVHLPEMAERAAALVHGILRALVASDEQAARAVAAQDDEIDRLYHATFDQCVALMRADPANAERAARIVIASHYLERIGDRATNIAEDIVFLVTGDVEDLNP